MIRKRKRNRGRFRKGFDKRRHTFTHAECVRGGKLGYQAALSKDAHTAAWIARKVRKLYAEKHQEARRAERACGYCRSYDDSEF